MFLTFAEDLNGLTTFRSDEQSRTDPVGADEATVRAQPDDHMQVRHLPALRAGSTQVTVTVSQGLMIVGVDPFTLLTRDTAQACVCPLQRRELFTH